MNKLYKGLWIAAFLVVVTMAVFIGSARAESNNGCSDIEISEMKNAILNQDLSFDLNNDGVVNLSDVTLFAKKCYSNNDDVKTPELVEKHSSINKRTMSDGSITFYTQGRSVLYEENNKKLVISWKKGTEGSFLLKYQKSLYLIYVDDGIGINVREK